MKMMGWRCVLLMPVVLFCHVINGQYGNEYRYAVDREHLKLDEIADAGGQMALTQDESIVNLYLQHLKWQEFNLTRDSFVPLRGIEETYEQIISSKLFATLKKFPKGGNMHIHEHHTLDKETMLQLAVDSPDYEHLYVTHPNSTTPWQFNFYINPPSNQNWVKFKDLNISVAEAARHTHLMGILDEKAKHYPSDTGHRWALAGPLFGRLGGNYLANVNIQFKYLQALFDSAREENIQYLESRRNIYGRLYTLDSSPNYTTSYGQRKIDEDGSIEIEQTIQFIRNYTKLHPEFFGLTDIIYQSRGRKGSMDTGLQRYTELYKRYPTLIRGFDLVGEEDKGYTLLFYLDKFLSNYDTEEKKNKMPFYFHTAETNWPGDLQPNEDTKPDDPVSTIDNAYDAVMLGSHRIGHGLGFEKHPYLLKILRERGTAIEVCPASNQILGYVPDIRTHPAVHFLRAGVPIVLGGDDPGTFGYNYFTVDWYLAFVGWGLDLADMKKMALNSLNYSALNNEEKSTVINDIWLPAWNKFISETKREACNADFSKYDPYFARILPRQGALKGETKVQIFGRWFEKGICKTLYCKFGDLVSNATMNSPNNIECLSPLQNSNTENKVNVSISFDGGSTYIATGASFTYKYDIYVPTTMTPEPVTTARTSSSQVITPLVTFLIITIKLGLELVI